MVMDNRIWIIINCLAFFFVQITSFLHRMVETLGESIFPYLPLALEKLLTESEVQCKHSIDKNCHLSDILFKY